MAQIEIRRTVKTDALGDETLPKAAFHAFEHFAHGGHAHFRLRRFAGQGALHVRDIQGAAGQRNGRLQIFTPNAPRGQLLAVIGARHVQTAIDHPRQQVRRVLKAVVAQSEKRIHGHEVLERPKWRNARAGRIDVVVQFRVRLPACARTGFTAHPFELDAASKCIARSRALRRAQSEFI